MGDRDTGERPGLSPPGDDPALTERLKARDEGAFGELVERYESFVYNVAYRMLGQGDLASETAQEVFLRVWQRVESFAGGGKLSTWIYAVTVNVCRDHLRRSGKHRRMAERLEVEGQPDSKLARPPVDLAAAAEEEERMMRALAGLSPDQRVILLLKHSVGLSYQQISKALRVSVPALKMRASRAREALRRILSGEQDEGAGQ